MITLSLAQWLAFPRRSQCLAAYLGVSPTVVSKWKHFDRAIPAEHVLKIERFTRGEVRAESMRHDLYWSRTRAPR